MSDKIPTIVGTIEVWSSSGSGTAPSTRRVAGLQRASYRLFGPTEGAGSQQVVLHAWSDGAVTWKPEREF